MPLLWRHARSCRPNDTRGEQQLQPTKRGTIVAPLRTTRTEGSRVVRQTSNSAVAGLPTATAPPPAGSGTRTLSKFSAREHRALGRECGRSDRGAHSASSIRQGLNPNFHVPYGLYRYQARFWPEVHTR